MKIALWAMCALSICPFAEAQAVARPAQSQVLTNQDVIRMLEADLPESVIIARVQASQPNFDTSPDALVELRKAGASERLLMTILELQRPQRREGDVPPGTTTIQPAPPAIRQVSGVASRTELFTGYSLDRSGGQSAHGWNFSVLRSLNDRIAIVADIDGHYLSLTTSYWAGWVGFVPVDLHGSAYSFLGGLQFFAPLQENVRVFARGLVGPYYTRATGEGSRPGVSVTTSTSAKGVIFGGGSGLDITWTDRLLLRAVQFDYFRDDEGEDGVRLSAGLVVRWF